MGSSIRIRAFQLSVPPPITAATTAATTTTTTDHQIRFRIYVRLRTDDLRSLRPYRELVNTLIHELSHNAFGPHTEPFWRLFALQKRHYLRTHAGLQAKGVMVKGVTASRLAGLAER
jgi:hypothetical protein